MADLTMADYDSPGLVTETHHRESQQGPAFNTRSRHQDRFAHKPCATRRKSHGYGAKAINKLTEALAQSNFQHGKGAARKIRHAAQRQASGQGPADHNMPKTRRSKIKARKAREAEKQKASKKASAKQSRLNGKNGHDEARETHSMPMKLPLGFCNSYLRKLGNEEAFMDNSQIRTWMESIYDPHLKEWYHTCLSTSTNQPQLKAAREDPFAFAKAVLQEATYQHDSSKLLQSLLGEKGGCPTAFHVDLSQHNSLNFVQHAAMVACLIVRDGQRGGNFETCTDEHTLHHAAIMLLISMIMDLRNKSGYFAMLVAGFKEEIVLPNSKKKRTKNKKMSKTVKFPFQVSDRVEEALHEWEKRSMHCQFKFDTSSASRPIRFVHLMGSKGEIQKASQEIQRLVEDYIA